MSGPDLRFTEEMSGHVAFGERDARRAAIAGRAVGNRVKVHLTVEIDHLARFAADPNREAGLVGWVDWDALGGRLPLEGGAFNLLVDGGGVNRKQMRYRLHFRDGVGHPVTLVGTKLVGEPGLRVWSDTTTLHTRVLTGHVAGGEDGGELVASGILRLRPTDFARQLTTFRASGPSLAARGGAIARFGLLFGRLLWHAYNPPVPRRVLATLGAARARLRPGSPRRGVARTPPDPNRHGGS